MTDSESSMDRYACRHCRRVLFTSDDLAHHVPESHQIATRRLLKDAKTKGLNSATMFYEGCSSWFLEDVLPWMDEEAMNEGKLKCPNAKCQSRVGSFSWSGSQCSCGTWVTPSIKLTKSRVDLILPIVNIPIVSATMYTTSTVSADRSEEIPLAAVADNTTESEVPTAETSVNTPQVPTQVAMDM